MIILLFSTSHHISPEPKDQNFKEDVRAAGETQVRPIRVRREAGQNETPNYSQTQHINSNLYSFMHL